MAAQSSMNLFDLDNTINGKNYDTQSMFFEGFKALPEGLGWFIVVGLGFVFCAFTSVMVFLDQRFGGTKTSSEQFSSAGRTVSTGLIACDIVSKWTWAATLLQSSNVAYKLGVSGPFWYASGATIQILLFAILAVEVKRKAPTAHTFLEIILARWGKPAHLVFMCFGFATNIIVTSMLILGGAAVTNALTGVNLYAAAFLIPISVVFYTAFGGLKACFIASWAHCGVIYAALCVFIFLVYAGNSDLGSIDVVYNNLEKVAREYWADFKKTGVARTNYLPLSGNQGNSYLTILSEGGLIFGVINIIGNFGTVFVDQSYWQSAIAAKPSAAYKGYIVGGLCWFAVPFTMATTMGLGARALDIPLTIDESNAGLVPPALAVHMLGQGGGFLLVLQLFLAVTSTASAEQIAVSSLVAYDLYRTYINPKATGKQILFVSRAMIVAYGVVSGLLAIILLQLGLNLGWVYLFMGVVIGSAVPPVAMSILWNKLSAVGAITAACVGMACSITSWLVSTSALNKGVISVITTGQDYPMLIGNLVAIFISLFICIFFGLVFPSNYDWEGLQAIPEVEVSKDDMDVPEEDTLEAMEKAARYTWWVGGALSVILIIVWPALAVPAGVFSKPYFTMWVIVAMAWGLGASLTAFVLPVWEARATLATIFTRMIRCDRADTEHDMMAPVDGTKPL